MKNSKPKTEKVYVTYSEKFNKGYYERDRQKVSEWALRSETKMEILEAGINSNGTEFVTIKFNNLPH